MSDDSTIHRLREVDIPALEEQIHDQDELLPSHVQNSEKVLQIAFLDHLSNLCAVG